MKILVTGGAGFVGSNFVRYLIGKNADEIAVFDKLTYAGRMENLQDVIDKTEFIKGDICDAELLNKVCKDKDAIVNFAAETHVDRSIADSSDFVRTDVVGTHALLEAARKNDMKRFVQISTDEVYGSIAEGSFDEDSRLSPSNPYSASKAGADMLAQSFFVTYGLPLVITRSTNNYGPYQHTEKFIPRLVTNALRNLPLPIYGDGMNVRDWLYVEDNCEAIELVLRLGKKGEVYNIASQNERSNIEVAKKVAENLRKSEQLIIYVKDRLGHDRRYSLNAEKVRALGWLPRTSFEKGLARTIAWYASNRWWWQDIAEGS